MCYTVHMRTYRYIEEYIEVIAGVRDPVGNNVTPYFLTTSPINLARYDVKIIASFAEQISGHISFTDKQSELAVKIVLKYEKQLAKLGVDVSAANEPQFRIAIRQLDRTCRIWADADSVFAKFPFNEQQVNKVKEMAKDSPGSVKWDRELKAWRLAVTEYNVNWIHSFAVSNQFVIDDSVQQLMDLIIDCEGSEYKIELTATESCFAIINAAPELTTYIEQHVGGFALENMYNLVDHADILGYTVDPVLEQFIISNSNARQYNLLINKDSKLGASDIDRNFADVIQYATLSNRWPVYVYEPNLSGTLLAIAQQHVGADSVICVSHKTFPEVTGAKIVYFNKYHVTWPSRIPLLVSTAGMLFGGEKQMLLNRAEKVVYLTHDVYNKTSRGARPVAS